jgi:hypothetical protein
VLLASNREGRNIGVPEVERRMSMKKVIPAVLLIVALAGSSVMAQSRMIPSASALDQKAIFTGGVQLGYFGGPNLHLSGTVANFAEGFPFRVRLGLGYAWLPSGDAVAARRVFIDANTNGTPKSWGTMWDGRLDVLYPVNLFSLQRSMMYAGIRRSSFVARFEYIGGNETFNVNTKQWGIGGGLETSFALSPRVDMVVQGGADYYFRAEMSGHDTYYRPNGDDLHPIANYTYKDADAAIDQPDIETRLMLGLAYRF